MKWITDTTIYAVQNELWIELMLAVYLVLVAGMIWVFCYFGRRDKQKEKEAK